LGLPEGEEIMTLAFFVLTQYLRVTDSQTDGHVTCAGIALRGYKLSQMLLGFGGMQTCID